MRFPIHKQMCIFLRFLITPTLYDYFRLSSLGRISISSDVRTMTDIQYYVLMQYYVLTQLRSQERDETQCENQNPVTYSLSFAHYNPIILPPTQSSIKL
jgi:hypothetical protein